MNAIDYHQLNALPLYCDNQFIIILKKNPHHYDQSKHIDRKYHYFRMIL